MAEHLHATPSGEPYPGQLIHDPAPGGHPEDHGHGGLKKYVYVFLALCVLTTASFFTYSEWWRNHFEPQVGWAFMLAVSVTKAMLVILFFMHVKYEANWKYVLTIPAAMMSVFLILMLVPDIGMRGRMAAEEIQRHQARPEDAAHATHAGHSTDGHPTGSHPAGSSSAAPHGAGTAAPAGHE